MTKQQNVIESYHTKRLLEVQSGITKRHQAAIRKVQKAQRELLLSKGGDYNNLCTMIQMMPFGDKSWATYIWNKAQRLSSVLTSGTANHDAIDDIIIDLANYAIAYLAWRQMMQVEQIPDLSQADIDEFIATDGYRREPNYEDETLVATLFIEEAHRRKYTKTAIEEVVMKAFQQMDKKDAEWEKEQEEIRDACRKQLIRGVLQTPMQLTWSDGTTQEIWSDTQRLEDDGLPLSAESARKLLELAQEIDRKGWTHAPVTEPRPDIEKLIDQAVDGAGRTFREDYKQQHTPVTDANVDPGAYVFDPYLNLWSLKE